MSNLNLDASEKQQEFGIDMSGPLRLHLGSNEMVFADGMWISEPAGGVSNHREIVQTKRRTSTCQRKTTCSKSK
ncbi:hypothetical protein LSAT2_011552 [Lamellibrachia satsuma]|nr:hypothetical protein LSAT2_011552 [Lamellibrachia satsuma]